MKILAGNSHTTLASELAALLSCQSLPVSLTKFPNGEKRVQVGGEVEGETILLVQSFSEPVDEHIIEFCLLADALKHLKANHVVAIVPWFGYSPQDKSFRSGEPISAHVIARIIESLGVDAFVTVDIHSKDTLRFFSIPTLEVSSLDIYLEEFANKDLTNHVVVSVDKGSRERCAAFASKLQLPICEFDKVRDRETGEVSLSLISGQVDSKIGIAFDDFVSTGSTRIAASSILKSMGMSMYIDCITHGLLAEDSPRLLQESQIDSMYVTNTYPIPDWKRFPKLTVLSIAPVLAKAIQANLSSLL